MSNQPACVRFKDGLVLFTQYQGSADMLMNELVFCGQPALGSSWRCCTCSRSEPVEIASAYGEHSWDGKACRWCGVVTDGHDPYDQGGTGSKSATMRGMPQWAVDALHYHNARFCSNYREQTT